jgi:hypothetical protein
VRALGASDAGTEPVPAVRSIVPCPPEKRLWSRRRLRENAPATCVVPLPRAATLRLLLHRPHLREDAIAGEQGSSRAVPAWIESWQPEDAPLLTARQRAAEVGVGAVDPATGAVLRLLAATTRAKSVVELGTGVGVSGLWLLRGMRDDGVLTSVDARPSTSGWPSSGAHRGRRAVRAGALISGRALEVLPRLSDRPAYDSCFRRRRPVPRTPTTSTARCGGCGPRCCGVRRRPFAGGKWPDPAQREAGVVACGRLTARCA